MTDTLLDPVFTGPAATLDPATLVDTKATPWAVTPLTAEPPSAIEDVQSAPAAGTPKNEGIGEREPSGETAAFKNALSPLGGVPAVSAETLDAIRSLYLKECFDLLREPEQMARLRRLLQSLNAREALQAFQMLLTILVPHTKPEEMGGRGVNVQIVNTIRRPSETPAIEVTAEAS